MMPETDEIKPCLIYIDKEGCWTHKGVEMIRKDLIQLFYQNMELDSEGRYIINWQDSRCYVDVEDAAYVVTRVLFKEKTTEGKAGFVLNLSDGTREILMPETLRTGNDNVLYCKIKGKTFPARFIRPAYYQLAEHLEEEKGTYFVRLNGRKYPIEPRPTK